MQLQHQVPGKVLEGTEGSGADTEARFRKVLVQSLGEVPEGSGADTEVRFWKVPLQSLGEAYGRFRA